MEIQGQPGLRERKRIETRDRIENAAVRLVLEHGIDGTTVDSISDLADISPRTFFNYFESKEDAVLGFRDIDLSDEFIAAHLDQNQGSSAVSSVVGLIFAVLGPSIASAATHSFRHELSRKYPELLARQVTKFMQITDQLAVAASVILAHQERFDDQSDDERLASAEILLSLCTGGTRLAMKEWMSTGIDTTPQQLEKRANSLITDVTGRIQ